MSLIFCGSTDAPDLQRTNVSANCREDSNVYPAISLAAWLEARFFAICVMTMADNGAAAIEAVSNHNGFPTSRQQ